MQFLFYYFAGEIRIVIPFIFFIEVTKMKLLGLIVDQKLTWVANVLETKKGFAKKLDLLKRSRFFAKRNFKRLLF